MSVVRLIDRAPIACSDQEELFAWLRGWGDALESGEYGDFRSLMLVAESKDGQLAMISQGLQQIDNARIVGLLMAVAHRSLNGEANILDLRR